METGERARRRWSLSLALGTGALAADLALSFVPFYERSFFSALVLDQPARAAASSFLALFATAAVIGTGLAFLVKRDAAIAAGILIAAGTFAGVRAASDILITDTWPWETVVYVGLKAIASALLFAAAILALRVNRRGGMP
jgi:hypothetical protein